MFVPAASAYSGPGILNGEAFLVHGGQGTTSAERQSHTFTWQNPTAGADPGCSGGNGAGDWYTQTTILSGGAPTYAVSGIERDSCGGTRSITGTITLGACPAPRQSTTLNGNMVARSEPAEASASVVTVAGPNPFTASSTILYAITEASHVRLAVYDVLGREVAVLVDEEVAAGQHSAVFEGAALPADTYLYRLEAGDHTEAHPITLVR